MGLAEAKSLTAKQAIAAATAVFADFFGDVHTENVLLEELEFDEKSGQWLVTIGFDVGRKAIQKPAFSTSFLGEERVTPIREARRFILSDQTGELVKMETA